MVPGRYLGRSREQLRVALSAGKSTAKAIAHVLHPRYPCAELNYQDAAAGLVEALQRATVQQGGQGVDQEQGRAEDKGCSC